MRRIKIKKYYLGETSPSRDVPPTEDVAGLGDSIDHGSTRTSIKARVYDAISTQGANNAKITVRQCKTQAFKAYLQHYNQVTGILYRNISTNYGLDFPVLKWSTPPKVIENNQTKTLWDFHMVDVTIQSDGNVRKKERENLENNQGLKRELERFQGVKASAVPMVIGAHSMIPSMFL